MPSSIFKDHSNRKRVHDDKGKSPRRRIMKNPIELADIMHPRVEERESLPRPRRDSESFDFLSTNEEVNDSNLTLDFGELEVDHDCEGNGSNALISGRKGFERFLSAHDEDFASSVRKIWDHKKNKCSISYHCNKCGSNGKDNVKCCNELPAKFVRNGIMGQLQQLMSAYLNKIISIRKELKEGKQQTHNLASQFFSPLRDLEENEYELRLSGILSIDGVAVPGTQKKLWPISLMLVDLPTNDMQKSSNVMLEGIIESSSNPSTTLWNAVLPIIMTDCESREGTVGKYKYKLHIATVCADQPVMWVKQILMIENVQAKRSLFGMRAHHGSSSCFYCLSPGTFYKMEGEKRVEKRPGNLTVLDSEHGVNGFGTVPALIISYVKPYETPIDLLHNLGEGICEHITKELFSKVNKIIPKSDLFVCNSDDLQNTLDSVTLPTSFSDISNCRNGTDKISFFRLNIALSAIHGDFLKAEARFAIVALSMIANKMFATGMGPPLFDEQMCAAARWFLKEASNEYLNCKTHELLFHLPDVIHTFGNVGPLGTFAFESSYQFALMGYSSRLTRNFPETVCSRVLIHNSIRREVSRRSTHNPSSSFKKFLSFTKGLSPQQVSCKNVISSQMEPEDKPFSEGRILYGSLSLPCGRLISEYHDRNTTDDVFYAVKENGQLECHRFVAATMELGEIQLITEPFSEIDDVYQFSSLSKALQELDGTNFYYGQEVIRMLKEYEGVKYCRLSEKRVVVPLKSVISIGSYIDCGDGLCVLAVNGTMIHN
ncbi:hypothetical protein CRE_14140 [Caenorhabditis remanei]|uniref:Uncharacterized protein n=1 Tax=Caenorhabditis remanei TaxID=31234 RepID=E3MRG4_CAERE|nr:hypothetical protein CRE_14140 [Caenorhabditis remanei]